MTLPQFPSQDLAKLVLGYLAEEQLMTAYDEFLQASPYLDALRNEYDRIFMTSLKNILAEYRAVKIYVETCKPFILRKKLFQCANLLETVKFLVNHVDVTKIISQDATTDTSSTEKINTNNECEGCSSLKLATCVCKNKTNLTSTSHSSSKLEVSALERSVETTPLADLPGNHVTTRKKQVKILDKEPLNTNSNVSSGQNNDVCETISLSNNIGEGKVPGIITKNCNVSNPQARSLNPLNNSGSITKLSDASESLQKVDEFSDVLNFVANKNSIMESEHKVQKRISYAGNFQDFASGVTGSVHRTPIVVETAPEKICIQPSSNKSNDLKSSKSKILVTVSSDVLPNKTNLNCNKMTMVPKIKPKSDDSKIHILSNIKVDKGIELVNNQKKKTSMLNNATSTPLMQMQTIVINGTSAYNHKSLANPRSFTKDEIMAMPTLIVVPATGSSQGLTSKESQPTIPNNSNITTQKPFTTARVLGPLVIDVSSTPTELNHQDPTIKEQHSNLNMEKSVGLVKTVDMSKNASVPKEVTTTETNTPQIMPPLRKSCSTPRRTSHIRVLDFTTPRRILHETLNEQPHPNSSNSEEIVLSGSPNVNYLNIQTQKDNLSTEKNQTTTHNQTIVDYCPVKENDTKLKGTKSFNWDASLRAMVAESGIDYTTKRKNKPKGKLKHSKKKKHDAKNENDTIEKKASGTKKISPKTRKAKRRRKIEEEEDDDDEILPTGGKTEVIIKPTINIIPGNSRGAITDEIKMKTETEKEQKKPNEDDTNNTPEIDRNTLHNVIGAKLNISDIFETPFKQAIYDIQMETPKFLGPDLPDEPMSDFKIMNIPTPRFLDTPKLVQATPSSYSSRPTDYSSGGSYYKPDDQDFVHIPELNIPLIASTETNNIEGAKDKEGDSKKSRPVRKCTKNVSYYNNSNVGNKVKEVNDSVEEASSCSDSLSVNSKTLDDKKIKDNTIKILKDNSNTVNKSNTDTKRRKSSTKKRKTPVKKEKLKTFMRIKPRRPTPIKESATSKTKKKTQDTLESSPKFQKRNRTTSKDRMANVMPVLNSIPTKSRRKSSTPRKLHCTKTFNSESSNQTTPELKNNVNENITRESSNTSNTNNTNTNCDSDTEQLALRWSDDGSQDSKLKESSNLSVQESEDISKIQQYIESTILDKTVPKENEGTFQADLVKRGFDIETAKIIERDLLDLPPQIEQNNKIIPVSAEIISDKKDDSSLDKPNVIDTTGTIDLHIEQDEECEEVELSVHECNEETNNYITFEYDETNGTTITPPIKLKDKFSMEICIDDDISIRLRATTLNILYDQIVQSSPLNVEEIDYSYTETEAAVKSISDIDKLYTPIKESIKAQCYEIFDSTLTSLDTPLKSNSPRKDNDVTVTQIILEEESLEAKNKHELKKRKRINSDSDDCSNESKKSKPEAQYLFNSANIQNFDIESVLKKLHGPEQPIEFK